MDFKLLKTLCETYAPAGQESELKQFMLDYITRESPKWKVQPTVFADEALFQDNIVLVFGQPRTAVFAHLDSIGFTVRYDNELVKLGGPRAQDGWKLWGKDSEGKKVKATLRVKQGRKKKKQPAGSPKLSYKGAKKLERGQNLVFSCNFRETKNYVQSCYLDDRLGCWNALKLCETLQDGIVVFSTWEETGGGAVPYLIRFIYENYGVRQALISDITWVTHGVKHGEGVAISLRDSLIPRRAFTDRVVKIARKAKILHQLEVEDAGGSDGKWLQFSPYPIDWAFVGAPEDFVHSPDEKVHKKDIRAMLDLYKALMEEL